MESLGLHFESLRRPSRHRDPLHTRGGCYRSCYKGGLDGIGDRFVMGGVDILPDLLYAFLVLALDTCSGEEASWTAIAYGSSGYVG